MTAPRFSTWLPPSRERGRGSSPADRQDSLLHDRLERVSPPESLVPGASKECAVSVHPNVSASLGGTGGSRHELLEYHLSWRGYRTAPRFSTWLPPAWKRSRLATFQFPWRRRLAANLHDVHESWE